MKRFQFLLLDAGPIMKLFELSIWDELLRRCDVTICRTVAEEAKWASRELHDVLIDLEGCGKEALAFLDNASEEWLVCAADKAVFKAPGLLGKAERGVSLERVLAQIGLGRQLEWRFTERFREKYTALGQTDAIQDSGPG